MTPPDTSAPTRDQDNATIARRLNDMADLLEAQGESGFRVRAYRAAAGHVEAMSRPLRTVYETGGVEALVALPTIGRGIALAIVEMLTTGQWSQLDRLSGETTPEAMFRSLPGVGPVLADRFALMLDAQTLEDLAMALANPKMKVPGLGDRRRAGIRAALDARLAPIRRSRRRTQAGEQPPVSMILDADSLYRRKAKAGDLRLIAPKRHNPTGRAWLPILHLSRDDWHFTVLFSNTRQAHLLHRTDDWVVVFFHKGDGPEDQCTVVTQSWGDMDGRRVVRGREEECRAYYRRLATPGTKAKSPSAPDVLGD